MKKKFLSAVLSVSMLASVLTGCGNTDNSSSQSQTPAANTNNADNAAQGDDAQRRNANGFHIVAGLEQIQERARQQLKQQQSDTHDRQGIGDGQLQGLHDPHRLRRPVVVGHDRHHAVVQPENGHEDKALELEINPEDRRRGGGE